jgi:hypothetical protein
MNLLKTLARMFRKGRYTSLDLPSRSFSFLSEPTGDVQVLKDMLRAGLIQDAGLRRAYFCRIRYADDEKIQLALCVDTESSPDDVIGPLSEHCAQYFSSIDILFFSDIAQHHIDQLKSVVEPFCESPGD